MSKRLLPDELQALLNARPALKRLARAARASSGAGTTRDPLECLPPALRERVRLVEQDARWLALVETSATAQLLRFHLPRLERALPDGNVKIVVTGKRDANGARPTLPRQAAPRLDANSAAQIRQAADTITDPGLQAALRRLASREES